jgi:hypothetical protein
MYSTFVVDGVSEMIHDVVVSVPPLLQPYLMSPRENGFTTQTD